MGDSEDPRGKMDRSDSSADEPRGTEKKMKVDTVPSEDTEMVAVEEAVSTTDSTAVGSTQDGEGDNKENSNNSNANAKNGSSIQEVPASTQPQDCSSPSSSTAMTTEEVPCVPSSSETLEVVEKAKEEEEEDFGEPVELRVVYNKKPLAIKIPLKKTVGALKLLIEKETKVAPALQKVLLKGIPKDDATLESLGVTRMSKILVIGTSLSEVMEVAKAPDKETLQAEDLSSSRKESGAWCTLTQHKKVLDKGVPEDVMPGILNESEPLPDIPLFGMLNSKGGKVRLTFKLETDELWIGTKERTEKVPIGSIRTVQSQPITGYEHYHIVAIQLGPTEASRYFIYWVPAQYIDAIKDALVN